jgi:hypothetical protein
LKKNSWLTSNTELMSRHLEVLDGLGIHNTENGVNHPGTSRGYEPNDVEWNGLPVDTTHSPEHISRAIPPFLGRALLLGPLLKDLRCERMSTAGTTERLFLCSSSLYCASPRLCIGRFIFRVAAVFGFPQFLSLDEASVGTFRIGKQVRVGAMFEDLTVTHHVNMVCILHGGQTKGIDSSETQ